MSVALNDNKESAMSRHKLMLAKNIAWAGDICLRDPDFFRRMGDGQQPDVLWIGCSDSRVPAEKITHSAPGELFVHRNIANIVSKSDSNAVSVVEYAITALKISHVIVCGHYQCGGVLASLCPADARMPDVNRHIDGLRQLAARHRDELDALPDQETKAGRLAELNVLAQIETLGQLSVIRNASHEIHLHGWIFNLNNGLLRVLHPSADVPAAIPAFATGDRST